LIKFFFEETFLYMLYLFHKTFERKRPKETVMSMKSLNQCDKAQKRAKKSQEKYSKKQNKKKYKQKTRNKKVTIAICMFIAHLLNSI